MVSRKSGDERRREILGAMLDMAADDGPERVTTKALASRVGVSEPALYRHFPEGKPEMWRSVARLLGDRMQAAWRAAVGERDPAPERLGRLISAQLRLVASVPALPAILFSRSLHRENAVLRAGMAEVAGRFHAKLQHIIDDGQRAGEIVADVDSDAAAWLLISVVQGTAIRWSLSDRSFDLEAEGVRIAAIALNQLSTTAPSDGGV